MVDPDPCVSMQKLDGSRERGNVEASYSTGEAANGSVIGGNAELGGKNEAPSAIGGGADLGGGNGKHVVAPKDCCARFTRDTSQVQSAASEEDHSRSSGVQIQEPDGSRERGKAEANYSTGEVVSGSAIGGGVELGGRNEALSAIGGGADLGGGNGEHVAAPEGHRNEMVTMLEVDTILNERVHETIVKAQEGTISRMLGEMAWKGSQHLEIPLCRLKQSHWVCSAYDLNMAIYTSFT
ncbi:hypothetical protein SELMODRAFT_411516 [Selaginella moellendorffii]|uniref:Uncharacterized protein n=1 Tax=Selaginella moellendorffii TaxID=88036 RepID=D8RI69_SELML|nr:hypothetical protein SELMODRAFT_411516 [Selaginella moellendorffii]